MSSHIRRRWRAISGMSAVVPSRMVMLRAVCIIREVYRETRDEMGPKVKVPHPNVAKDATLGWGTLKSLFVGVFFRQPHFGSIKLLLHLGEGFRILFGG